MFFSFPSEADCRLLIIGLSLALTPFDLGEKFPRKTLPPIASLVTSPRPSQNVQKTDITRFGMSRVSLFKK
jgi:hypothetical protein